LNPDAVTEYKLLIQSFTASMPTKEGKQSFVFRDTTMQASPIRNEKGSQSLETLRFKVTQQTLKGQIRDRLCPLILNLSFHIYFNKVRLTIFSYQIFYCKYVDHVSFFTIQPPSLEVRRMSALHFALFVGNSLDSHDASHRAKASFTAAFHHVFGHLWFII
jgi:hypothetical protein